MDEKLLTAREVAEYVGVSPCTVNRWRFNEKISLPFIKIGRVIRYKLSDVSDFILECTQYEYSQE